MEAANPNISDKDLKKGTELLPKMRELVQKFDLRPCVRSIYVREVFQ